MSPKTPRKTMAEIRAEECMRGFSQCMEILVSEWRSRVHMTPHAGRKGFILDSDVFLKDGLHQVFFETDRHGIDNAYSKPEYIRRLKSSEK